MWKNSLLLLVALVLLGCGHRVPGTTPQPLPTPTLEDRFMDKSILTGEPCEAPCWYGLEVGQSTRTEVLDVVSSLSFIDPEETIERPSSYWDASKQELLSSTHLLFECKQPKYSACAGVEFVNDELVEFVNDELKSIHLRPNYYLSFQEVVEHLGTPDYVQFLPFGEMIIDCDITLEWTRRHIEVYSRSAGKERCAEVREGEGVNPNLPVHEIFYTSIDAASLIRTPDPNGDFPWTGFTEP